MATGIKINIGLETRQADSAMAGFKARFKSAIDGSTSSVGALRSATTGLTGAITALGAAAAFKQVAQFGIDLDRARNTMTALTGSVTAANKKLAELRELAKASPGVTNTFATQLFNQLKAIGGIGDEVINKVIKSLGKLNTVFSEVGPEFSRNLVQIFQQGFERADIKEALGRVPIFEQLLQQAFGTKDPEKLRKLKESGKLTLDAFLTGFSDAVQNDARFKNVQESLGGKLQKSFEDTKLKLAELGEKILQVLIPALDKLIPILNTILDFLNQLPDGLKAATIGILAMAPAINGVAGAIAGLRGAVIALGGFLATPAGIAVLALLGVGTAAVALQDLIENQIPANVRGAVPQVPTDLSGNPIFKQLPPGEVVGEFSLTKKLDFRRGGLGAFNEATGKFGDPVKTTKTKTLADLVKGSGKAKEAKPTPVDLLFFAQSREFDLAAGQRAIDSATDNLVRTQLQGQRDELKRAKDEAEAFGGIVKQIQENNAKATKEATEAQEKFNKELQETIEKAREFDPAFRFMRGLRGETDQVASSFERLGQRIGDAFGDVKSLLSSLGNAVKQFFGDILSATLRTAAASALAPLFGGGGGGGGLGSLFRTQSFAQAFGGGGISAAPSTSLPFGGLFGVLGGGTFGGSVTRSAATSASGLDGFIGASVPRTAGKIGGGFSLGAIGKSFAAAAPFLGFSFGSGVGGQSTAGGILGGIGGALGGLALGASTGAIGGGLGSAFALSGALGPFALAAAPLLLIGGALLGKAKQRKADEEAAGQLLIQAQQQIVQLKDAIAADQVDGGQARGIFESQILGQFRQGINSLKTESVRKSRLTNQVGDLHKVFNDLVIPQITAQDERRRAAENAAKAAADADAAKAAADAARFAKLEANALTHSKLIPEFAFGGWSGPGGIARLHANEVVMNQRQLANLGMLVAGAAGVPGLPQSSGISSSSSRAEQPLNITIDAAVVISEKTATGIYVRGAKTDSGRAVTINNIKVARTNREI